MPNDRSDLTELHLPKTSRSLPIALIRAREKVMAPIREMLQASDITEQQWRVLRVLSEYGPQDATQLAERASLLPPSLTRITRALESRGFISQAQNAQDRRRQDLAITPEGQRIIDDNLETAVRIVASYKAKLGDDKYEDLLNLLELLAEP